MSTWGYSTNASTVWTSEGFYSIAVPGVSTPGIAQDNALVIEESAKGNAYTIPVAPETRADVIYVKDAARAIIELGQGPINAIKMVNYVIAGNKPKPSAVELANVVKSRIPAARINFQPAPPDWQAIRPALPTDNNAAQEEWGWNPRYGVEEIVDDFLREIEFASH